MYQRTVIGSHGWPHRANEERSSVSKPRTLLDNVFVTAQKGSAGGIFALSFVQDTSLVGKKQCTTYSSCGGLLGERKRTPVAAMGGRRHYRHARDDVQGRHCGSDTLRKARRSYLRRCGAVFRWLCSHLFALLPACLHGGASKYSLCCMWPGPIRNPKEGPLCSFKGYDIHTKRGACELVPLQGTRSMLTGSFCSLQSRGTRSFSTSSRRITLQHSRRLPTRAPQCPEALIPTCKLRTVSYSKGKTQLAPIATPFPRIRPITSQHSRSLSTA